jgi:hypothetical protein
MCSVYVPIIGYNVPSKLPVMSQTPGCFWRRLRLVLTTLTCVFLVSSQNSNLPVSISWHFRMLLLNGQHLWTSWLTLSWAALIVYISFGPFGVDGAVLGIESTSAGYLVNATTFSIICYSKWLELIATPRTFSAVCAYCISLLVLSAIRILLLSPLVHSHCIYTSPDHCVLFNSTKSVSLSVCHLLSSTSTIPLSLTISSYCCS